MAFATLADFEARTGVTVDLGEVSQVEALLDDATAIIRKRTGQHITQATSTVTLQPFRSRRLQLPELPVTAVTSVTQDGVVLVGGADYDWYETGVVVRLGWLWALEPVTVEYTHGFATIPEDVKAECVRVAQQLAVTPPGVRQERFDDYTVTFEPYALNLSYGPPAVA